jgi:hypothetical protein
MSHKKSDQRAIQFCIKEKIDFLPIDVIGKESENSIKNKIVKKP